MKETYIDDICYRYSLHFVERENSIWIEDDWNLETIILSNSRKLKQFFDVKYFRYFACLNKKIFFGTSFFDRIEHFPGIIGNLLLQGETRINNNFIDVIICLDQNFALIFVNSTIKRYCLLVTTFSEIISDLLNFYCRSKYCHNQNIPANKIQQRRKEKHFVNQRVEQFKFQK